LRRQSGTRRKTLQIQSDVLYRYCNNINPTSTKLQKFARFRAGRKPAGSRSPDPTCLRKRRPVLLKYESFVVSFRIWQRPRGPRCRTRNPDRSLDQRAQARSRSPERNSMAAPKPIHDGAQTATDHGRQEPGGQRDEQKRAHVYKAANRANGRNRQIGAICCQRAFGGSARSLLMERSRRAKRRVANWPEIRQLPDETKGRPDETRQSLMRWPAHCFICWKGRWLALLSSSCMCSSERRISFTPRSCAASSQCRLRLSNSGTPVSADHHFF